MVLQSCILFFSMLNGIDPNLTNAIISVESNGRPMIVSADGFDHGLMQIRQKYVPYTKLQLLNACTNVMVGTELLAKLKKSCKRCVDKTWIIAYNLGPSGAKKIKHPKLFPYYRKVIAKMEQ